MFNILVVEDDRKLRNLFCTVLSHSGYCAISAENGMSALEILDTEYIDLIISDIMMPGMDGYELFYPQIGVKPCSMAGGGVSKNIWNCFRTAPEGTGQPLTCSTSGMGLRLK